jgi:Ca-activated chloride channel family protein
MSLVPSSHVFPRFSLLALLVLAFLLPAASGIARAQAPLFEEPARLEELPILESPESAGGGTLVTRTGEEVRVLPLIETRVEILVTGPAVRGRIEQRFGNPSAELLEAVYLFPLPERAAVHHMEMRVGERRIVSEVREKEEARAEYRRARSEGKKAALVEQRRTNLFVASVANVNPGEEVAVTLEYLDEARYEEAAFALDFPLALTPRFEPPGASSSRAARAPLRFSDGGGPLASVRVELRPGLPLASATCLSHGRTFRQEPGAWVLDTGAEPLSADRDLRLSWTPLVREAAEASLLVEGEGGEGFGLLLLVPRELEGQPEAGWPTDTLFVVDVSGSMSGPSIRAAREALLAALEALRPGDRFNLLAFSSGSTAFGEDFVEAGGERAERAAGWIRGLDAGGGTMILPALRRALSLAGDPLAERSRRIVFLTDGAVGNEEEIYAELASGLGDLRLHTLGIGAAPNAAFMRKMASLGRGLCSFIATPGEGANLIEAFLERLRRPVLTDLELVVEGAAVEEIYPAPLPDLHASEPLLVSLRLPGGLEEARGARLLLRGRTHWGWFHREIAPEVVPGEGLGLGVRWARARVRHLLDLLREGAEAGIVREEVVVLGHRFGLVTPYTSLVAVERLASAQGDPAAARRAALSAPRPLGSSSLPRGGSGAPLRTLIGLLLAVLGGLSLLPALLGTRR